MKKLIGLLVLLEMVAAPQMWAATAEDLAGVYVGKRTETHPAFSERYDEVIVIEPDGRVIDYLYVPGVPEPLVFSGYLEIAEDGSFPAGDYGKGLLTAHGRHLEITIDYVFPPSPFYPEGYTITIVFRGHRTEKGLELSPLLQ